MKSRSNLVYSPVDGVTDVSEGEIMAGGGDGDWRGDLVPSPGVNDMMYSGGN